MQRTRIHPALRWAAAWALACLPPAAGKGPDQAPPLPAPTGDVVRVTTAAQLLGAVRGIVSGRTIVVAKGTYRLANTLHLAGAVRDVAIRGETHRPEDVVLVGAGMRQKRFGNVPHGILVDRADGVLIADLTIRDVWYHPIQFQGACRRVHVYHCRLLDAGEQFIKACPDAAGSGVAGGIVAYTTIAYTTTCRGWYTNGVDVLGGRDWVVRHCLFRNIRAAPGSGRQAGPAVLMWRGSRDTVCEANTFVNCERGIAFGLSGKRPDDHRGGVIRNNFFYRAAGVRGDVGISAWNSAGTKILHNTVLLSGTYANAVEIRFPATTGAEVRYNLCDAAVARRDGAGGVIAGNVTNARPAWFADAPGADLHLAAAAAAAIDRAGPHEQAKDDFDGDARPAGAAPDIGADERAP